MATRPQDMDGNEISIYDYVGFKDDVEQSGRVVGFQSGQLLVDVYDSTTSETSRRTLNPRRVWLES
jgi:hypothetical protein